MVGAPRFELGTPSPPDRGGHQKSLGNFANGHPFGRPPVNGLALVLQTVRVAKCSNSVAIGGEADIARTPSFVAVDPLQKSCLSGFLADCSVRTDKLSQARLTWINNRRADRDQIQAGSRMRSEQGLQQCANYWFSPALLRSL